MKTVLLALLLSRATHVKNLCDGLSVALEQLGHPELARITELIRDDAQASIDTLLAHEARTRARRKRGILAHLVTLSQMGGAAGTVLVLRVWRRVVEL